MGILIQFAIGLIFGVGLVISGMVDPAKVLNFLDVTGSWDPSLAFVMAGAIAVTVIGYRVILVRPKPLFALGFQLPTRREIDARLVLGAGLFGVSARPARSLSFRPCWPAWPWRAGSPPAAPNPRAATRHDATR